VLVNYELCDIGDLLISDSYIKSGGYNLHSCGITINNAREIDIGDASNLFLRSNNVCSVEEKAFANSICNANGRLIGYLQFNDVFVIGPTGLIVDPKNKIIWYGRALGWTLDRAFKMLDENLLATRILLNKYRINEENLFNCAESVGHAELVSSPGYQVYGHWLLDVIPRLYCHKVLNTNRSDCLLAPSPPSWAADFVRLMGYDACQFKRLSSRSVKFIKRLDVHTLVRYGVVFDRILANNAWQSLIRCFPESISNHLLANKIPQGKNSSLYVSRASWKKSRTLSNSDEIYRILSGYGVSVIHPQEYRLVSQMYLFSNADIVLGEDGSGLHNIVYSSKPGFLGVISMGRNNLWHAGLAHAKQWRVAYVRAEDQRSDGLFFLDGKNLHDLLDLAGKKRITSVLD
jgi:hypothetical protein